MSVRNSFCLFLLTIGLLASSFPTRASAETLQVTPVSDVTAVLDQEKPDADRLAVLRAAASALPPPDADGRTLARFYFRKAYADAAIGHAGDAIADTRKALELGRDSGLDLIPFYRYLGTQLVWTGRAKEALQAFEEAARIAEQDIRNKTSWVFHLRRWMVGTNITLGNLEAAAALVAGSKSLLTEARQWPQYADNHNRWEGEVEEAEARLLDARGMFADAEAGFHHAQILKAEGPTIAARSDGEDRGEIQSSILYLLAREGLSKMQQGRLVEAEADVRSALLGVLHSAGKYNHVTPAYIIYLANLLAEQGRLNEAEQLLRTAIDICRTLGFQEDSDYLVRTELQLAEILSADAKWQESSDVYATIDNATATWAEPTRNAYKVTLGRLAMLYGTGQTDAGVEVGRRLTARQVKRFGERHAYTALARGSLAYGLMRLGQHEEAERLFEEAVPVLVDMIRGRPDNDGTGSALRERQARTIIESAIALFAAGTETSDARLEEIFRWADAIRGRSVQTALVQAAARSAAGDDALSTLARREQDLATQLSAQFGLLTNLLAQSPERRDEQSVSQLKRAIDDLHAEHDQVRHEIRDRFPRYAALVDPAAPTIADVRSALAADEAFVSVLVGAQNTFVWIVPKEGRLGFTATPVKRAYIANLLSTLRQSLDPGAALVSDIPNYDFAAAFELYSLLLAPTAKIWAPARTLVVSVNGQLGTLPFAVLTTRPFAPAETDLPFAGYRDAPWLVRTHAISQIPSAAAFTAIRNRVADTRPREDFVGFGDPVFSADDSVEAPLAPTLTADATTRGIHVQRRAVPPTTEVGSAELAQLPRLPDTALELRAIASTLGVDPKTTLYLEKDANEETIRRTDLTRFRIVAFATHGLVPGDLQGLNEPALALTSPAIAGVGGDGLLTMSEILNLKLNADWVLLSACNSAAGATSGAEAASGLARAFFYAGARSALVTDWPVHSVSARLLMTDMFRRQATDPSLSRAVALRQAMINLIDGPGYLDAQGAAQFSYAHPTFWAPYVIIGDGGN